MCGESIPRGRVNLTGQDLLNHPEEVNDQAIKEMVRAKEIRTEDTMALYGRANMILNAASHKGNSIVVDDTIPGRLVAALCNGARSYYIDVIVGDPTPAPVAAAS
jgi:hypothetical protein